MKPFASNLRSNTLENLDYDISLSNYPKISLLKKSILTSLCGCVIWLILKLVHQNCPQISRHWASWKGPSSNGLFSSCKTTCIFHIFKYHNQQPQNPLQTPLSATDCAQNLDLSSVTRNGANSVPCINSGYKPFTHLNHQTATNSGGVPGTLANDAPSQLLSTAGFSINNKGNIIANEECCEPITLMTHRSSIPFQPALSLAQKSLFKYLALRSYSCTSSRYPSRRKLVSSWHNKGRFLIERKRWRYWCRRLWLSSRQQYSIQKKALQLSQI